MHGVNWCKKFCKKRCKKLF